MNRKKIGKGIKKTFAAIGLTVGFSCILFSFAVTGIFVGNAFYSHYELNMPNREAVKYSATQMASLYGIVEDLFTESNSEDTEEKTYELSLEDQLALAGAKVSTLFFENGWKIEKTEDKYLTSSNLEEEYNQYDNIIVGLTSRQKKIIYLSNDEDINDTFIHELGHVTDFELGDISKTEEFLSIYEEEKDMYVMTAKTTEAFGYAAVNEREYFACCFAAIVLGYDDVALEKCPKTAEYIKSYIYYDFSHTYNATIEE